MKGYDVQTIHDLQGLLFCTGCGCFVASASQHDVWHRIQDALIAQAMGSDPSAGEERVTHQGLPPWTNVDAPYDVAPSSPGPGVDTMPENVEMPDGTKRPTKPTRRERLAEVVPDVSDAQRDEELTMDNERDGIGWYISDTHARRAIGYLTAKLPQLNGVDVPYVASAWAEALVKTMDGNEPSPIGPEASRPSAGSTGWDGGAALRELEEKFRFHFGTGPTSGRFTAIWLTPELAVDIVRHWLSDPTVPVSQGVDIRTQREALDYITYPRTEESDH